MIPKLVMRYIKAFIKKTIQHLQKSAEFKEIQ